MKALRPAAVDTDKLRVRPAPALPFKPALSVKALLLGALSLLDANGYGHSTCADVITEALDCVPEICSRDTANNLRKREAKQ